MWEATQRLSSEKMPNQNGDIGRPEVHCAMRQFKPYVFYFYSSTTLHEDRWPTTSMSLTVLYNTTCTTIFIYTQSIKTTQCSVTHVKPENQIYWERTVKTAQYCFIHFWTETAILKTFPNKVTKLKIKTHLTWYNTTKVRISRRCSFTLWAQRPQTHKTLIYKSSIALQSHRGKLALSVSNVPQEESCSLLPCALSNNFQHNPI